MGEENNKQQVVGSEYNLDAKWDACLDLGVRRFAYFSLIGGFAGLLLLHWERYQQRQHTQYISTKWGLEMVECTQILPPKGGREAVSDKLSAQEKAFPIDWENIEKGSPVTRWASTAFGAGTGIGSAYTECSQIFGGYPGKSTASVSETPITKDGEE